MLNLFWTGLFANPLYTLIGAVAVVGVASGYAGIKGYQFGSDRQQVLCNIRVNAMQTKINQANAEIDKQAKQHAAALEKIEEERQAETAAATVAEQNAAERIRSYATELSLRTDKCLPTPADIERLH